jgi:predicted aldo/keto reductase-like oxidoreductase
MSKKNSFGRRQFVKKSALGLIGAGITGKSGLAWNRTQEETEPKVKDYRILGRTEFKVSDIAGGSIQDEGLIGAMLDRGVNYIDTAEQYPGHHAIVAKAIKGRERKSFFISSKIQVLKEKTKEGFLKRARKCLEDLQTDYLDCMMMHMPENTETLKTEGFHQAMQQLKTEGRIKYVGVSNHGSFWFRSPEESMEKVLLAAAEDGRFDVFLMAYNFLQMDQAEKVLEVCKEKKIGTTLMKTTPIAKFYAIKAAVEKMEEEGKKIHPLYKEGLKNYQEKVDKAENFIIKYNLKDPDEIKDAAIRFVLGNPNVNTVCCSMKTYDDLDRFVRLSGTRLSDPEKAKLAAYREGCGELYCRHACGICEPQCPHNVPINTIMRYDMYFNGQGRERYAMEKYREIQGSKAEKCISCQGYCEAACPFNVPIQGKLITAHSQLSFT